jgi:hypothetical protein
MKAIQMIFGILAIGFLINGMTMVFGLQPEMMNGFNQFLATWMAGFVCTALFLLTDDKTKYNS